MTKINNNKQEHYDANVRLSQHSIHYIKKLAKNIFSSSDVYIFGSRADVSQRGGDIDIFIKTEQKKDILNLKLLFLRELKKIWRSKNRFNRQK